MKDNLESGERLLVEQYLMLMRALLEIAEDYFEGKTKDIDMELVQEILKDQNEIFNRLTFKKFLV
jgi:hypothetical protein